MTVSSVPVKGVPRKGAPEKSSPQRTCAVCRKRDDAGGLVRFVLVSSDGPSGEVSTELALDLVGTSPGRGAYCHLRRECLENPKLAEALISSLTRRGKLRGGRKIHSAGWKELFHRALEGVRARLDLPGQTAKQPKARLKRMLERCRSIEKQISEQRPRSAASMRRESGNQPGKKIRL